MWNLNSRIWYSEEEYRGLEEDYKKLEAKLRLAESKNAKYENHLIFKCLEYFERKD